MTDPNTSEGKRFTIQVCLTEEEWHGITALALKHGAKPQDLVRRFVSDATGSLRSHGSDERMMAEEYLNRGWQPRLSEITEGQRKFMEWSLCQAYQARRREEEVCRGKRAGQESNKLEAVK